MTSRKSSQLDFLLIKKCDKYFCMDYSAVVTHPLFSFAHSGVQALSILSLLFRVWWFLVRAPVTRNSACWDFFGPRQSVLYFLSHYSYKLVQICRFHEPGARLCRDTHLPPSLQSQLTSSLHLFIIYSPAECLIAQEILSLPLRLYSTSYQKLVIQLSCIIYQSVFIWME